MEVIAPLSSMNIEIHSKIEAPTYRDACTVSRTMRTFIQKI
jgi:hypothetical protein